MSDILKRFREATAQSKRSRQVLFKRSREYLEPWGVRFGELARHRRTRKIGLIVVAVVAFFGIATYFAVPPILRHVVTGPVAKSIHRQVSVGKIGFNLYRLRLDIDKLHVSERDSPAAFVDVGHLRLKVSWASLFRFAPVIGEVAIDRPAIHVVRANEQRFNFSDLLEGAPAKESKLAPASAPMRFAVSNIQIRDGDVQFDDQLLGEHHAVEHIHVNVPFIANLPQDVDIFVEPLLEMVVDGSRLHLAGVAKPFGAAHDSVVDLKLHRLDLRQYLGYVPRKVPIKIPKGTLSADVYVHFLLQNSQPSIRLNGTVALDQLDVRDAADAPLIALTHGEVKLTDVEPLGAVIYLRSIRIDGLTTHLVVNPDGSNNLSSIVASNPPPQAAAQTQATITQPRTVTPVAPSAPMDFALESFDLVNSAVEFTDKSGATPAAVALDGIHIGVVNLRTIGQVPATYDVSAKIRSGGAIAVKGGLDLVQAQASSDVALDQIDLPALQAFAQSAFAGNIASGKITAKANLLTHFASGKFNLHVEPANVSIENFEVHAPRERETPAQWKSVSASIGQFDLAAHTATVNEVRADGMRLFVRREHSGRLSLESLMRGAAAPEHKGRNPERVAVRSRRRSRATPAATPTPSAPPGESWKFQVASIALEQTDATFEDHMAPRPIKLALAPLNLHLKDVSSDLAKPIAVEIDGTLNRKGTFKVTGTAAPNPLKADLRVATERLDLSFADPYVSSSLNATITSANLTMDGAVGLEQERKDFIVSYRGDASLGSVRMLDKLTGDLFFKMAALNVNKIDFSLGKGPPKVHVGEIALNNFYSRVILNSNGKMNLKDITASPQEAPTSLTRAAGEPGSKGAAPIAPTPTPSATPSPSAGAAPQASPSPAEAYKGEPMNADVELSRIVLKGGKVDYTDNFIKPNYTANLSEMEGKIGAFGTKSTSPADVSLDGKINGSAPINIDGSVNPLAPTAFVDIKANANGIELTGLTPYTTKYTGFPIVKGTLTVDVHYLLDAGKLTADNHIFIDQLTFGDHVDSPDATNLPIRLAVSLLKNSKGQIDVRVPVSGSLSDPQFSIGSIILGAFMNLIVKAATSPFTLIAAAFGGSGAQQDLGYIEFAPGYVNLTPESQQKLDTVAKALQDRTALRLNISGRADPQFDKDGYREASLEHSIEELRRKDEGDTADEKTKNAALSKENYNKYLSKVYSAGKFQKPRDLIGLAKTQPPDEMKKLILANTPVTDQDLQHLAEWRANAVRAYLSTKQVDAARMFVIAPKLDAKGIKDQGKTTRVDLSLE